MIIEPLVESLEKIPAKFLVHVLNALPVEFTIIDAEDTVLFWNLHGIRVFKRGPAIIGRDVRLCHPEEKIDKVNRVIAALRSGESDYVDFWMNVSKDGVQKKILLKYIAIRDSDGKYLGTIEATLYLSDLDKYDGENKDGIFH